MPEYLSPGVYVEELQTGPRPIEGVSTSTAGFVGQTERGPESPLLITSWLEFQRWYGYYLDPSQSYLPYAVQGFFDNGGQRLYVTRVVAGAVPNPNRGGIAPTRASTTFGGLSVAAIGRGEWGNKLFAAVEPATKAKPGTNSASWVKLSILYYSNLPTTKEGYAAVAAAQSDVAARAVVPALNQAVASVTAAVNDPTKKGQAQTDVTAAQRAGQAAYDSAVSAATIAAGVAAAHAGNQAAVTASANADAVKTAAKAALDKLNLAAQKVGTDLNAAKTALTEAQPLANTTVTAAGTSAANTKGAQDLKEKIDAAKAAIDTAAAKPTDQPSADAAATAAGDANTAATAASTAATNAYNAAKTASDNKPGDAALKAVADAAKAAADAAAAVAKTTTAANTAAGAQKTTPSAENAKAAVQAMALGPAQAQQFVTAQNTTATRKAEQTLGQPHLVVNPLNPQNRTVGGFSTPDRAEVYDNLVPVTGTSNSIDTMVNAASRLVHVTLDNTPITTSQEPGPDGKPAPLFVALAGGSAGTETPAGGTTTVLTKPNPADYVGTLDPIDPADLTLGIGTGLGALGAIEGISLLSIPDEVMGDYTSLTQEVINQCELQRDRFGIVSVKQGQGQSQIPNLEPPQDTTFAAFYYPWIEIYDPVSNGPILIPATGHITGLIARVDIDRGVHKAPANEVVRDATDIEFPVPKANQDILNPKGVNCIRDFRESQRGIRLWGARTMSSDPEWKYINVRRLFIFIEQSIYRGTQWVVFEPNDEPLWAQVRRAITAFLVNVWKSGALMGPTEADAFFVKCDRTTMTQDDIDNGRLVCLIGIAPTKPAEFVIFRISQKTAEAPQ